MASYDQWAELVFHNISYIFHAFIRDESLVVEVEQAHDGSRWTATFPSTCKPSFLSIEKEKGICEFL